MCVYGHHVPDSELFCVFYLCILVYNWITIIGYSKRELRNNIHVVLPKTKSVRQSNLHVRPPPISDRPSKIPKFWLILGVRTYEIHE